LRSAAGARIEVDFTELHRMKQTSDLSGIGMIVVQHVPPFTDGMAALRSVKRRKPDIPVIVATTDESLQAVNQLFNSGAAQVWAMSPQVEDVLACYETLMPGFRLVPPVAPKSKKPGPAGKIIAATLAPGLLAGSGEVGAPTRAPGAILPLVPDTETHQRSYRELDISFFGDYQATLLGAPLPLSNKARYIFAYLAYHHPRPVSRDMLAREFWPDLWENAPACARRSLAVYIANIRQELKTLLNTQTDPIPFEHNGYRLKPGFPIYTDVQRFREIHQAIKNLSREGKTASETQLRDAIGLYKGQFMEDLPEDKYNWVEVERRHHSSVFEQIADLYSEQMYEKGDYRQAIAVGQELLELDNRLEAIHRRLMQCYFKLGKFDQVETQYRACCQMMDREFQSKPSQETLQVYIEAKKRAAS
jgi:DNA-binding SARP family transcriptional activator